MIFRMIKSRQKRYISSRPQLQSLSSPPASLFKTSSPRISPRRWKLTLPYIEQKRPWRVAYFMFMVHQNTKKKELKHTFSHGDCSRPRTGSSPPEASILSPSDITRDQPVIGFIWQVSMCSPRDPSSIVDLYCDDEFALSLEFHPNMVLYPVQGVTSMEQAEIGKIDGNRCSSNIFQLTDWFPPLRLLSVDVAQLNALEPGQQLRGGGECDRCLASLTKDEQPKRNRRKRSIRLNTIWLCDKVTWRGKVFGFLAMGYVEMGILQKKAV